MLKFVILYTIDLQALHEISKHIMTIDKIFKGKYKNELLEYDKTAIKYHYLYVFQLLI